MKIFSKTDKGMVRSTNQDSFIAGVLSSGAVFGIVCDGMGGANAGNVASETAVKIISEYIKHSYRIGMDEFETEKMLKNAIDSANSEIYEMSSSNETLNGMGTTVVIALVQNNKAIIANVGDSRIYLLKDSISQLTRDHSVVQSLIESGKISPEDAKVHPRKNVITRAIGAEEDIVSDTSVIELEDESALLLCTDGLSSYVDAETILKVFKNNGAEDVPKKLIELANNAGGSDNITVVLLTQKG